jgi:transposase-like protein
MRGVERLMVKFNDRMVTDVVQTFWAAMARGEFITGAAAEAGTYRQKGRRWLRESGGVRPRRGRDLLGRCLTFPEREEIALAHARGQGVRQIARSLGRSASTISRALQRNVQGTKSYRATTAHTLAYERASRRNWRPTCCCGPRSRRIWRRSTHRSRSPVGCVWSFPTTRRCRCHPRRSASRCTCSLVARCAGIWRCVCTRAGRCVVPAARSVNHSYLTTPTCHNVRGRRRSGEFWVLLPWCRRSWWSTQAQPGFGRFR